MYILNIIICNPSYINDYTLWGEYTFEQESRSHFQKVLDQWSSLNEEILVWSENIKGPIIYISQNYSCSNVFSSKGVADYIRRRRQLNFFWIKIYLPIYIFFVPLPMYSFQLGAYRQYIEVWRRRLGGYEWIEWLYLSIFEVNLYALYYLPIPKITTDHNLVLAWDTPY